MRPGFHCAVAAWALVCASASFAQAQPEVAPAEPLIPFRQDTGAASDLSWRAALALLVCGGLAVGGSLLLRRRFPSLASARGASPLQIVETRRLDAKRSLFVVNWHGTQLLVGAGEGGLTLLARHPGGVAPEEGQPREDA